MSTNSDISFGSTDDTTTRAKKSVDLRRLAIFQRELLKDVTVEGFDPKKDTTKRKFDISEALLKFQTDDSSAEPYSRSLSELKDIFEKQNAFLSECIAKETSDLKEIKNDIEIWENKVSVMKDVLARAEKNKSAEVDIMAGEKSINSEYELMPKRLKEACALVYPNNHILHTLLKELIDTYIKEESGYMVVDNKYSKAVKTLEAMYLVEPHPNEPLVYKLVDIVDKNVK